MGKRKLRERLCKLWKGAVPILQRRRNFCANLCSGKSNFKGGKAAIVAIFKEKRLKRLCILKIFDNISNIKCWQKRTTSLANLSELCQKKQLHWNIFINYHQLCSSGFTNQKWYLQALLSSVIQIIPASHLNNSRHFELINQMR